MRLLGIIVGCMAALVFSPMGEADDQPAPGRELRFDPQRNEFVEVEAAQPGTAAGDLSLARQAFAAEHYNEAYRRIKKWLKNYPDESTLIPAATVLKARIEVARKNFHKAHKILKPFLAETPPIDLLDEALHYEFTIAEAFLKGAKRELWGMKILSGEELGLDILDDIVANYPESPLAELALKTKADHHRVKGEFALAELDYGRLAQEFPRSRYVRYALRKTADAALANFAGVDFDDAPLIEAEQRYSNYLAQFPDSTEREEIRLILQGIYSARADKELSIAQYYERARRPSAAAFYYRSTAENWPDTVAAAKALERLQLLGLGTKPTPPPELQPEEEYLPPPQREQTGVGDMEVSS